MTKTRIPNLLTALRIALVPLVCWLLLSGGAEGPSDLARWFAASLFIAAAITDFFDGYLARKWQVISNIGRLMDPIADKLLVTCGLFALAANGDLTGWALAATIAIIIRELSVTGLREFLAERDLSVSVTWIAKWKATVQMVAMVVIMIAPALGGGWLMGLGTLLILIAAALTLWSGYDYFAKGLRQL